MRLASLEGGGEDTPELPPSALRGAQQEATVWMQEGGCRSTPVLGGAPAAG